MNDGITLRILTLMRQRPWLLARRGGFWCVVVAMGDAFCPECADHLTMTRLGVGGSTRYYLCTACGLIRADRYSDNGIIGQVWHASPDALSAEVAREEAEWVLRIVRTEQLELF